MRTHTRDVDLLLVAFRNRVRTQIADEIAREHAESAALVADVIPVVSDAVATARAAGLCGRAWLFGSFAAGDPNDRSDVDLLVEGCADPDRLAGEVWRRVGRPVHVVEIDHAPASLRKRVLVEGRPL